MSTREERTQILQMIEKGILSPPEGLRLLRALSTRPEGNEAAPEAGSLTSGSGEGQPAVEFRSPPPASADAQGKTLPEFRNWKRWWSIPLGIGVVITLLGASLMFLALQKSGYGFWFYCSWLPFLLGIAVIVLAWASRSAPWLHVRVHRKPGESLGTILFSIPLPLRPAAWFLRNFGSLIPDLKGTQVDELILALESSVQEGAPVYVNVDEGEDGEQVEVFIG